MHVPIHLNQILLNIGLCALQKILRIWKNHWDGRREISVDWSLRKEETPDSLE